MRASWGRPGPSWGHLEAVWGSLGPSWTIQKFAGPTAKGVLDPAMQPSSSRPPPLYSPPRGALGVQEAPPDLPSTFGLSQLDDGKAFLGVSWGVLASSWGRLRCLLVRRGRLFSRLGCLLVRLGRPLGRLVGLLGRLGRLLGRFGSSLGRLWLSWGRLGSSLIAPGRSRGALGLHFVP